MSTFLSKEELSFFNQQGYFVIKGVYNPEEVEEIKQVYRKLWLKKLKDKEIIQDKSLPIESLFPTMHEMQNQDETVRKFMLDHRNFEIAKELLGHEPLVIGTTCFFKGPKTKALPYHQDNIDNGCIPDKNVALWISLDESDQENGSLCFLPKSHQYGLLSINLKAEHPYGILSTQVNNANTNLSEEMNEVCIKTQPGDVVVFDGNTIHGSSSNDTINRFRRSFAIHFTTKDVKKVFANFNNLYDREGNIIPKKVNKDHGLIRNLLLPEEKMKQGEKIY
ncbi:phytanoyl-CoA dioxygenase family protein [Bacillus sp. SM2101]|uniref:phytanoyl-CoA dioxygenase family protein n=1 Tax=Bacillus sp. SM2101 TaxID=2805366 RepID=UPI001BDF186B|nr:phytanoyl-CoA dioxygenase family protein [Bacillus sp. SM2101]